VAKLGRTVVLVVAAMASGCAVAPLPRQHFTFDATNEDYPVMLSRAAKPGRGRSVETSSETDSTHTSGAWSVGNTVIAFERTQTTVSPMPAGSLLLREVKRKDRWLQIEGAVFYARERSQFGGNVSNRAFRIRGTVHK
jgi:hypothetical protein